VSAAEARPMMQHRVFESPVVSCASPYVSLSTQHLAAFCARWRITRLRLVGSAIQGPYRADSDLDFVFHASFKGPLYAGAGRRQAIDELREIAGRKVDLVCPRLTLASANPYVIHNLLDTHTFDRVLGHAWNLQSAARVLAYASATGAEALLASPAGRLVISSSLLRLARACETPALAAEWGSCDLDDLPIADIDATVGPVLKSARALEAQVWPSDAVVAALIDRVARSTPGLVAITNDRIGSNLPEIPRALVEDSVGDAPTTAPRGAAAIVPPRFSIAGGRLILDPSGQGAARQSWAVLRFAAHGALGERVVPSASAELVSLSPACAPHCFMAAQIAPAAVAAVRMLAARGARFLSTERRVVGERQTLVYAAIVPIALTEVS